MIGSAASLTSAPSRELFQSRRGGGHHSLPRVDASPAPHVCACGAGAYTATGPDIAAPPAQHITPSLEDN